MPLLHEQSTKNKLKRNVNNLSFFQVCHTCPPKKKPLAKDILRTRRVNPFSLLNESSCCMLKHTVRSYQFKDYTCL